MSSWLDPDPVPVIADEPREVDVDGGSVELERVTIDVPPGSAAEPIAVSAGEPIGAWGDEWFSAPVLVEHSSPLSAPLTVSWDLAELTPEQQSVARVVHFDEVLQTWRVTEDALQWKDGIASAQISDFSVKAVVTAVGNYAGDRVASAGQWFGERLNKRVAEPTCDPKGVPQWVTSTIDPDEGTPAAAIRVCFDRDPNNAETVTVRVANNRSFAQKLVISSGGDGWAWTWPGAFEPTLSGMLNKFGVPLLGTDRMVVVPAKHEIAVGIGRPSSAGVHSIQVEARVDVTTVTLDLIDLVLNSVKVEEFGNPLLEALAQVAVECGMKEVGKLATPSLDRLVSVAFDTARSCFLEIDRWDSEFGARFEELVQEKLRAAGPTAEPSAWSKAYRLTKSFARYASLLKFGDVAFYASDQLANQQVGSLYFGVNGHGSPQELGKWRAVCNDRDADSNLIYRNLMLRSDAPTASTERRALDLVAAVAVTPVARCSSAYIGDLARFLPSSWADQYVASAVASALLRLAPGTAPTTDAANSASGQQPPNTAAPAPTCPPAPSAQWTGTWASSQGVSGQLGVTLDQPGSALGGTLSISGSELISGGRITGTVECNAIRFGKVDKSIEFQGVIDADGLRITGTYTASIVVGGQRWPDSGRFEIRLG